MSDVKVTKIERGRAGLLYASVEGDVRGLIAAPDEDALRAEVEAVRRSAETPHAD